MASILKRAWPLLVLSLMEGAALMAVELIGAKLLAPYYGNSIYVWSAVLGMTLGGLAIGYFVGGYVASRFPVLKMVQVTTILAIMVTAILPVSSTAILSATIGFANLQMGILISCFVILTPPLFLFGMVSPLVIHFAAKEKSESGMATGLVYATSTFGGIAATFLFAFHFMPYWGLKKSCFLVAGLLLFGLIFSFIRTFTKLKPSR